MKTKNLPSSILFKTISYKFSQKLAPLLIILTQEAFAADKPAVEILEPIAMNASSGYLSSLPNSWGLHQPRITRHADGSIRLLYLSNIGANIYWNLMNRDPQGNWRKEASGRTIDDVSLLRAPDSDRAHVVAWPNSIPTTYTSPNFAPAVIPGDWQVLSFSVRHYGNAGIGRDGTLCLKASHELSGIPVTASTNTEYACGKFFAASETWGWYPFIKKWIGLRHGYDFIFPNPEGLDPGLYATATRDIHKDASDIPYLSKIYGNYVFNGVRSYSTSLNNSDTWKQNDVRINVPIPNSLTQSPLVRLQDSLIDSKGRTLSIYYAQDPRNDDTQGQYLHVTDNNGQNIFHAKLDTPHYGYVRIIEDTKNRLWLLWNNRGRQRTEMRLYALNEVQSITSTSFTLEAFTDLSKSFYPYAIHGNIYIASPRGGNNKSQYIDGLFNACSSTYYDMPIFDSNKCYGADQTKSQRVLYTRIHLPD